jgi:hypothetical protein
MRLLGPHWDYVVTDQSGNQERLAFVFDTRKILFRHIAGEVVLPKKKGREVAQFNRTPYLVAFQAGWFKFNICTVHIYYGSASDTTKRRREIADVAAFFTERQTKDGETYILLGDFNILNPEDPTMRALLGGGFEVRPELRKPTALASANFYDQIALRTEDKQFELRESGCFHWQDYVYREADFDLYKSQMPKKAKSGQKAAANSKKKAKAKKLKVDLNAYKKWRTWQISDHLPLWAEIRMDFTESYLRSLKAHAKPLADFNPETGPRPDANT